MTVHEVVTVLGATHHYAIEEWAVHVGKDGVLYVRSRSTGELRHVYGTAGWVSSRAVEVTPS